MAKKPKRITDTTLNEARTDVTWRNVGLLSAFAILLVISIFTVMIPELTDDGADEEADAVGTSTTEPPPPDPSTASPHTP